MAPDTYLSNHATGAAFPRQSSWAHARDRLSKSSIHQFLCEDRVRVLSFSVLSKVLVGLVFQPVRRRSLTHLLTDLWQCQASRYFE